MTTTDLCRIGSRLKQARTEKHLTQAQLAEMIDRSTAYIGLIERGKRIPGLETFMDVLEALGVTADYILCDAVSYGYRVRLEEYAERIDKLSKKEKEKLAKIITAFLE